jgi:hypothetical protein
MGRASQVLAPGLPLVTANILVVTAAFLLYHLSQVKAMQKRQDALEEDLKQNRTLTEVRFIRFREDLHDLEQKLSTLSPRNSDPGSNADLAQKSSTCPSIATPFNNIKAH